MSDSDPWLTIDATLRLRWIGQRVDTDRATTAQRREWLEAIRRAASQEGELRVTGRQQLLAGYSIQGTVLLRTGSSSLPGERTPVIDPGYPNPIGSSDRRIIPSTEFIDGSIRRVPGNSYWWLIGESGKAAVHGWCDLRLLAADVRRLWPDAAAPGADARLSLKTDLTAAYTNRLNAFRAEHRRYPSRDEDYAWGQQQEPVITNARITQLREDRLPAKVRKGGRGANPNKPVE